MTDNKYDMYLAGPMRGYEDFNKPMFTIAAKLLRDKSLTVWNPSEHESYPATSFSECMYVDLNAVINQCRKICFLPGWRNSLGANIEAFVAFAVGREAIEICFNDDKTLSWYVPVDLSMYVFPYGNGKTKSFDPHSCGLDSFPD